MAQLTCEHSECTGAFELAESHSMIAVLQKVDSSTGYSYVQCAHGQEFNFLSWQHFHCSHDHMKRNVTQCLTSHYHEEDLHPIPSGGGTTNIHRIVLGSNLACKVCQQPLTTQAYRFCLTACTPVNHVPDNSLEDLSEWCCSLEHARQSAHATVENLTEVSIPVS